MNKTSSRLLIASMAVAVAAIMVGPASVQAQAIETQFTLGQPTIDKPNLVPDVDIGKIHITGKYAFTTPATVAGAVAVSSAVYKQSKEPTCDANGVTVTGPGSVLFELKNPGTTTTFDVPLDYSVSASQAAPGERDIKCTFVGKVLPLSSGYKDSPESTTQVTLKAKFLGLLSASIPSTIAEAGPQKQITYEIELTNLGNALTYVNFNLAGEAPEGWSPVPPTPIIMQSQQQGGTEFTKKVNFLIQTPHKNGWNNDEKTFQLKIQPSSTKDPELKGNEIGVNVLARVRGIYVPGPEPFLLVAALLGTALVARMARRE